METTLQRQDAAALARAVDTVASTAVGAPLLQELADEQVRIRILADSEFYARRPVSVAASYDYVTSTVELPRSRLHTHVAYTGAALVHEARHHHDMPFWLEAPRRLWAGVTGAVDAALHLRSPVTGFERGTRKHRDGHEVAAYQAQGALALELGDPRLGGGGARDGSVASDEQLRERLADSVPYRRDRRAAELDARPRDWRPPSDPSGSHDGPASALVLRADGSVGAWGRPGVVGSLLPAVAGGALAATAAALLRSSPRAIVLGAAAGALVGGGIDYGRRLG